MFLHISVSSRRVAPEIEARLKVVMGGVRPFPGSVVPDQESDLDRPLLFIAAIPVFHTLAVHRQG
jgi:hypothetical protein